LQDTALRAFDCYAQLREPSAARAWLFTILSRCHLNRLRAQRRRAETMSTDLDEAAFEAALAEWAPLPSPTEFVEAKQLAEQLTEALDALPPELRAVVLLVDVEGFTQREAAGMMGVPEGTVASRLFRARRQLRTALDAPARDARFRRHQ
jgi:RNA polymerase sigma-70 factor, ECF subfamily